MEARFWSAWSAWSEEHRAALLRGRSTLAAALVVMLLGCAAGRGAPAEPAVPPPRRVRLAGIDVHGTSEALAAEIHRRHDARIAGVVDAFHAGDEQRAEAVKRQLLSELQRMGDFAFADLAVFLDLTPGLPTAYAIVDLVEASDRARRMPFTPAPQRELSDPGGLLAAWDTFFQTGLELQLQGKLGAERVPCPAFHCLFDSRLPELAPLERRFLAEVPGMRDALVEILRQARDPEARAAAAFLLAYGRDGTQLVGELIPSILDPSDEVRNNVLRVLAEVANLHPEIAIPLDPLLVALDFPATSDRNKASLVLLGIAEHHPELRQIIATRVGPLLLAMLKTQAPQTHRNAFLLLETLRGEALGERDYRAWQAWLDGR